MKQRAYTLLDHAFYHVYGDHFGSSAFCFLQINFSWICIVIYYRKEHSEIDVTSGFFVLFGSGKNLFSIRIGLLSVIEGTWPLNEMLEYMIFSWGSKLNQRSFDSRVMQSSSVCEVVRNEHALFSLLLLKIFMRKPGLMLSFILSIYVLQSSREKLARYYFCSYYDEASHSTVNYSTWLKFKG